ncbi:MAG TPA: MurR/RpiR family transcriptional regulator, partial [Steroidobacter sp.]
MSSLVKIRAERDQMSAIERRIADFMLENAHLLRDYSSQQLADALQISQSSVVKFSQKLGFKGYPDLKYSIGEAVARSSSDAPVKAAAKSTRSAVQESLAETLWQSKSRAEEETRLINDPGTLNEIATLLNRAPKVFCFGVGEDGIAAQAFAQRLALLGTLTVHHTDAVLMMASISGAQRG